MKIVYFVIILVLFYFIATQVTVMHIETLPKKQKMELDARNRIRSMLLKNHITEKTDNIRTSDDILVGLTDKYSAEQFQSTDYKHNYLDFSGGVPVLPNLSNLLFLIRSEYVDDQYKFNTANKPVTTYSLDSSFKNDKIFSEIKKHIDGWNELFYKYFQTNKKYIQLRKLHPTFVMRTEDEFYVRTYVSLIYRKRTIHFLLTFYGQITRNYDFINDNTIAYIIQLVDIKPVPRKEFDTSLSTPYDGDQFMSLDEQMAYAKKINDMHIEENNI